MNCIQNCSTNTLYFKKATALCLGICAITVIAIAAIGLLSSGHSTYAIFRFNTLTNGILLGIFVPALVLDLVLLSSLCRKKKAVASLQPPSQPFPSSPPQSFAPAPIESYREVRLDPVPFLKKDPCLKIFSYLNPEDLETSCRVSKEWHALASSSSLWNAFNLKELFPLLSVFDEKDWATCVDLQAHGLTVDDASPLDKRKTIPMLKQLFSSLKIEENAGLTLLTLPKGLFFDRLENLTSSLMEENDRISFNRFDLFKEAFANPVEKTYRIVITNGLLEFSRDKKSMEELNDFVIKQGMQVPYVIEITTLLVTTYWSSNKRLFGTALRGILCEDTDPVYIEYNSHESDSFTLCADRATNKGYLCVGQFTAEKGIHMQKLPRLFGDKGAAGVKKL